MATVTWTNGGDGTWDDPNGWDTLAAPQPGDDVILPGSGLPIPVAGPSSPVSLNSLHVISEYDIGGISSNIEITGSIIMEQAGTFNGTYSGTTTGTFNNASINAGSTLTNGTFNSTASNSGVVTNATFNGTSSNVGTVTNATFNSGASNTGAVTNATFNDNASNQSGGTVGTGNFNDSSVNMEGASVTSLYVNADTVGVAGTAGELFLIGTLSGDKLSTTRTSLGTFTTLSLTGVPAATGGGGGPLGGPEIRF